MILIAVMVLILGGLFFLLRPDTPSGVPRDRTIAVSIEGGEMSPAEISVNEDDSVTLRVSSDRPMEIHLHGYDVEQEVGPGQKASLRFRADLTGRFEIEDHESEKELGVLQVRPGSEGMIRRIAAAALAFSLALSGVRPALAHGFGPTYDIPILLWLYLYGAAAVVLSFLPLALFSRKVRDSAYRYPRFDLFRVRLLRTILTSRLLTGGLRLLSVALFLVVVIAGLVGLQSGFNFAPTFVWVTWWVGLSIFTAFVGNLWPLVNPWRVVFDWAEWLVRRLGYRDGLELDEPYPEALGIWPAVGLYLVFVWIENVFSGSYVPRNIALFALVYSLITLYGMAFFGKETWLRRGDAFSVFFGMLGRFAPTEVRVKDADVCLGCDGCGDDPGCVNCYECFARAAPDERELNLRPPLRSVSDCLRR